MSVSQPTYTLSSNYEEKEKQLLQIFNDLSTRLNLKVEIDPPEFNLRSPIALDVEHDEEGNLVGIGVYDGTNARYYTRITELLRSELLRVSIIAHNGVSDIELLNQWGIPVSLSQLVWDTMLCAHIIDSSRSGYGLKQLAKEDLGIEYPSYTEIVGKKTAKQKHPRRTLDKWPMEIVSKYNALDCFITYKLRERQTCTQPKNILSR